MMNIVSKFILLLVIITEGRLVGYQCMCLNIR